MLNTHLAVGFWKILQLAGWFSKILILYSCRALNDDLSRGFCAAFGDFPMKTAPTNAAAAMRMVHERA